MAHRPGSVPLPGAVAPEPRSAPVWHARQLGPVRTGAGPPRNGEPQGPRPPGTPRPGRPALSGRSRISSVPTAAAAPGRRGVAGWRVRGGLGVRPAGIPVVRPAGVPGVGTQGASDPGAGIQGVSALGAGPLPGGRRLPPPPSPPGDPVGPPDDPAPVDPGTAPRPAPVPPPQFPRAGPTCPTPSYVPLCGGEGGPAGNQERSRSRSPGRTQRCDRRPGPGRGRGAGRQRGRAQVRSCGRVGSRDRCRGARRQTRYGQLRRVIAASCPPTLDGSRPSRCGASNPGDNRRVVDNCVTRGTVSALLPLCCPCPTEGPSNHAA